MIQESLTITKQPGAHDRESLEEDLALLAGELLAFLRHFTGDPELARDLAQETLALAFKSLARLRQARALKGWLYRIAINCFNDHLRHRRLPMGEASRLGSVPGKACWEPEREALAHELDEILRQELERLPPRQRSVLMLQAVRGLTQQEIAALLGVSRAAVKMSLLHAREAMALRVSRYLGRDPRHKGRQR